MPKKHRYDFYKAIQTAEFCTRGVLDRSGDFPEHEAGPTIDFIRRLREDLASVEAKLLSQ